MNKSSAAPQMDVKTVILDAKLVRIKRLDTNMLTRLKGHLRPAILHPFTNTITVVMLSDQLNQNLADTPTKLVHEDPFR